MEQEYYHLWKDHSFNCLALCGVDTVTNFTDGTSVPWVLLSEYLLNEEDIHIVMHGYIRDIQPILCPECGKIAAYHKLMEL